jgi:CRISPR-associated protein Cas5h
LKRDSYYEFFSPESTRFTIRVLNKIKKTRMNLNLINTKRGFFLWDIKDAPRTLIPFEFLKQPKYRIYSWIKHEEIRRKLKEYLEKHQSFYTPYLGISKLIANFKYIDECAVRGPKKAEKKEIIHSVIRKNRAKLIVEEGKRYGLERIPLYMTKDRIVKEYADVFVEINAKPMKIMDGEYYTVGNENVIFL